MNSRLESGVSRESIRPGICDQVRLIEIERLTAPEHPTLRRTRWIRHREPRSSAPTRSNPSRIGYDLLPTYLPRPLLHRLLTGMHLVIQTLIYPQRQIDP